jgi:hypothetical protein
VPAAPPSYPSSGTTFAPAAGPTTSGYAAAPYNPGYYNPGYNNPGYGASPAYPGTVPAAGSSMAAPSSSPPAAGFSPPPPASMLNNAAPSGTQQLKPIPDQNMTPGSKVNSSSNLRLLDPDNRTTSMPVYPAGSYTPVAWASANTQTSNLLDPAAEPVTAAAGVADDDNAWRPSNR